MGSLRINMRNSITPLMRLRSMREEEEPFRRRRPPSPWPINPLSLSMPLRTPCSTIKLCNSGPSISLLRHVVVTASVIFFTRQVLSRLSQKSCVFEVLWNKVTMFFTSRFLKGIKREEVSLDQTKREEVCWINVLPVELWKEIGKRIKGRLDTARFRSVCKIFRSSLPLPSLKFPLRVPPLPNSDAPFQEYPFLITQVETYEVKSESAIVALEEGPQAGKFITYGTLWESWKQPLLSRLCFVSKYSQVLSQHSFEFVSVAHHLRRHTPQFQFDSYDGPVLRGKWVISSTRWYAKRVAIISSNAARNGGRASDLSVIVHLNSGRLALLRLGQPGSFENWVWDTEFCTQVYDVIGTYKGRLYTLDDVGRLFVMDYESFQMIPLTPPKWVATRAFCYGRCPDGDRYLFEAFGDLYLAMRTRTSTLVLMFKFSFQVLKWRFCEDMAVIAALFPHLVD